MKFIFFEDTRKGIRTPVAAVKGRSPGPLDDTRPVNRVAAMQSHTIVGK